MSVSPAHSQDYEPKASLTSPSSTPLRILIFNCTNGRSGSTFLTSIHTCLTSQLALHQPDISANGFFTHVIFCTNVTYSDGHFKGDLNSVAHPTELVTQQQLAEAWKQVIPDFPETNIHVLPSIEHAIKLVQSLEDGNKNGETQVLVSGSLHLVGGVIEVAGLSDVAL
jgi:folylpolyglutamate synthase